MKRSSCASGRGYVPSYSMGFWVATTMNGGAIGWVTLSIVACRSSMLSSRLAWVFGEERLISSARTMLAKTGPGRKTKDAGLLVEHAHPGHVAGQQVGRELDAREAAREGPGQRLGEKGLADAGVVLDDHVPAGEQGDHAGLDHVVLAEDHRADVGGHLAGAPGERRSLVRLEGGTGTRVIRHGASQTSERTLASFILHTRAGAATPRRRVVVSNDGGLA